MKQRPIDALVIAVLAVLLAVVSTCFGVHLGISLATGQEHLPGLFFVLYVAPVGAAVLACISAVNVILESQR